MVRGLFIVVNGVFDRQTPMQGGYVLDQGMVSAGGGGDGSATLIKALMPDMLKSVSMSTCLMNRVAGTPRIAPIGPSTNVQKITALKVNSGDRLTCEPI